MRKCVLFRAFYAMPINMLSEFDVGQSSVCNWERGIFALHLIAYFSHWVFANLGLVESKAALAQN